MSCRDKILPPTPEDVRASYDNVKISPQNATSFTPIIASREEDRKYNLINYTQKKRRKNYVVTT